MSEFDPANLDGCGGNVGDGAVLPGGAVLPDPDTLAREREANERVRKSYRQFRIFMATMKCAFPLGRILLSGECRGVDFADPDERVEPERLSAMLTAASMLSEEILDEYFPALRSNKGCRTQAMQAVVRIMAALPDGEDLVSSARSVIRDVTGAAIAAIAAHPDGMPDDSWVDLDEEQTFSLAAVPVLVEFVLFARSWHGFMKEKVVPSLPRDSFVDGRAILAKSAEGIRDGSLVSRFMSGIHRAVKEIEGSFSTLDGLTNDQKAVLYASMAGNFGRLALDAIRRCARGVIRDIHRDIRERGKPEMVSLEEIVDRGIDTSVETFSQIMLASIQVITAGLRREDAMDPSSGGAVMAKESDGLGVDPVAVP